MNTSWPVSRQGSSSLSRRQLTQRDVFFGDRADTAQASSILDSISRSNSGGAPVEVAPLFCGLSASDQERIASGARVKTFTRGEMLYIEDAPVQQVVMLTSGLVKITMSGINGSEVIFKVSGAGDTLGAVGLFTTGKHCTTGHVRRACRALVWDAALFKGLVDSMPVLHRNMVRIVGADLLELQHRFHEVATERVAARVARQLVRLRRKMGEPVNKPVEIALSREELAQMTGTTLFTVSRLLSEWEARGIVRPRRLAVTICDFKSLHAMCDSDIKRPKKTDCLD